MRKRSFLIKKRTVIRRCFDTKSGEEAVQTVTDDEVSPYVTTTDDFGGLIFENDDAYDVRNTKRAMRCVVT